MEKVSVIVPVYNCEKYIERCINSLLAQSYKVHEIILVNDGSVDDSLTVCKSFEEKFDNVIVLSQENKGVSCARNLGIEYATGDYLIFCDGDDYVKEDYVEKLVCAIEHVDIAACGYIREGECSKDFQLLNDVDVHQFYYHILCTPYITGACWNKIFRRELIGKLRFQPGLSIGEDMLFVFQYLQNCKTIKYTKDLCYVYVLNQDSALQQTYKKKKLRKNVADNIKAAKQIKASYKGNDSYIQDCIGYRIVRSNLWVYFQMVISSEYVKQYGKMIQKNFKENAKSYKRIRTGSKLQDLAITGIKLSPRLFFTFALIGKRILGKRINKYLV